jgi:hypothetical protein
MDESAPNLALVPGTKAKLIVVKARPERARAGLPIDENAPSFALVPGTKATLIAAGGRSVRER